MNKSPMPSPIAEKPYFVHDRAIVEDGAEIGQGTRVWAFAHVLDGAVIGKECNLGDGAFVETGAKLGNHVTVKNGVYVWEGVTAEDWVFLGPNCTFTNDRFARSLRRPKESWLEKTLLKEGATIGANAVVVCGVTVGRHALVGAGSVVTKDVPDYALVLGNPAKVVGWVCVCGHKLDLPSNLKNAANQAVCKNCSKKYSNNHGIIEQISC
jgi:acetyltransferase-like isoleucine patch superfamily enzyme